MRQFLAVFLSLVIPISCNAQCNSHLRIGIITALSGEGQVWGDSVKNGFEMGLKDAGCTSTVHLYEDDQFSSPKTVSAFRKLIEDDHVNVVIVTTSAAGNTVGPLAEQMKVPLFAWASDAACAKNRRYVIRTWSSGEDEGEFIGKLAADRGYHRIARISSIHSYPSSVMAGMERVLPSSTLLPNAELAMDAKDFKAAITKARAQSPDAMYSCLMVPGLSGILARQMKQLNLQVPIFGCEALEFGQNFSESGGALANAWFVTGAVEPEFVGRFKMAYREPGSFPAAAIHYDLARILTITKAEGGQELINEVLSRQWQAHAMAGITPYRAEGDQALKVKLVARRYNTDGTLGDLP